MYYVEPDPPNLDPTLQLKLLKMLLILGKDQGTKLLKDAIGHQGHIWLNKCEKHFEGNFPVQNLVNGIREILESE